MSGRLCGVINVFEYITDLKQAEQASRRLAAIVESSENAIVSKDLNGIITSWNQAAERLFDYTAEEVVGKPVTLLIPPERHAEKPDILARIRRGERIEHYKTVRQPAEGRSSKSICLLNRRFPRTCRSYPLKSRHKFPPRERHLKKSDLLRLSNFVSRFTLFPIDKTVFICQNFFRSCDLKAIARFALQQNHRRAFLADLSEPAPPIKKMRERGYLDQWRAVKLQVS